jgi:VWFA-related protein
VLLDHSGSMEKRMDDARTAAIEFFKSILRKDDRAFIAPFASDTSRNAPFVTDVATLEAQVKAIGEAAGGTSLYDAIVTGLYRFRNLQGRKALIIITDGEDTTSRLSYDDMLTYARASRVPLYFIGIGFGFGPGSIGGPGKMRALAAETGRRGPSDPQYQAAARRVQSNRAGFAHAVPAELSHREPEKGPRLSRDRSEGGPSRCQSPHDSRVYPLAFCLR